MYLPHAKNTTRFHEKAKKMLEMSRKLTLIATLSMYNNNCLDAS
jgi:hypothetical protein